MRAICKIRTFIAAVSILALGIFSGIAPAAAQALFQPPTDADRAAAAAQQPPSSPLEIRSQVVRINRNVLARHLAPAGADLAPDRVSRAKSLDGVVTLNLFPDVIATFRRVAVQEADEGGYVWEGEVNGKAFHEALLLIQDGDVFGRVQLFNKIFRIDRLGNGLVRITELDQDKFPAPSPPVAPPPGGSLIPSEPAAPEPAITPRAKTIITILGVYTAKAKTEAGGATQMKDEIKTAVASANQAYTRGKIPIVLKLAGTMQVNYNEGNDLNYNQNLSDLQAQTGAFSGVPAKRNQLQADLVSLFRAGPDLNNCPCQTGLGFLPGNGIMPVPQAGDPFNLGFSVIGHKGIFDFVLTHELGHNFGLNHDRYEYTHGDGNPNPPNANYNFGYTNLNAKVYTIMAYFVECQTKKGAGCAHVNYFSSPTIKAQPGNILIGKAKGKAGAADNTMRMKQNYSGIAAYR